MKISALLAIGCTVILGSLPASSAPKPASVSSIEPESLLEFESLDEKRKALVRAALDLTKRDLRYLFGSNTPEKGGMDCSGAVQHALQTIGLDEVPRSSYTFYQWVAEQEDFVETPGVTTVEDQAFESLRPGDLLFWKGTYETGKRDPPISHVMIYLGTLKEDGKGVVFGASDGRRFRGKRINGVSVFDWKVPSATSTSRFVGFAPIPGLAEIPHPEGTTLEALEESRQERPKVIKSALEKLFRKPQPEA